ncbi:aspartate-semialdehyde dehydrogenase [Brettanomyces nanus]|uniref:Aspartate-semialdehyde dehydrogenase n=1 Tax=Eeniella nana TaxID=13502 RepID=A0A875S087_EENNA|nr:aspartate-semialdehyde dehydrogenase [Brettanomyces nanus]QPG73725.1 aspartate-semialdehyde dehydrogenase [Brettanomyces nanus]
MPIKMKAGVLGATGSVGQRFILLLSENEQFDAAVLGASSRSAGKKYQDAVVWKQTSLLPGESKDLIVQECKPEFFIGCNVIFSGLDAEYAGPIEKSFVDAGFAVVSNAKNYRRVPSVPLVVPTVNSEHLEVVVNRVKQARSQGLSKPGFEVCISNCSTAGLVVPLKPLQDKFGPIRFVAVTTMQAISGAGFSPGTPGIDILDNVVPYISGEEDKMEWEAKKILCSVNGTGDGFDLLSDDQLTVSAQCNRVAVSDGHTECVSWKFTNRDKVPSLEEVKQCLKDYSCEATELGCPSAPKHAIYVLDEPDRPQPRLDRNRDRGYAVSVGRLREDPIFDFKMTVLSHNTIIGAAGSGILIAELLAKKGVL